MSVSSSRHHRSASDALTMVVVPVYNEDQDIVEGVLTELTHAGYDDIVLVDDGSKIPTTFSRESFPKIRVVRHAINRGKGAAVKTGIEVALLEGADQVVTFDGDGQHDASDIQKLVAKLSENYSVVLGSRLEQRGDMPFYKVVANHVGNAVTWVVYGIWVRDSQSGLRAYAREAIERMNIVSDRYEYDSEVIREIRRQKLRYAEVPIRVRYTEYARTKATRQNWKNGIKTLLRMINF